MTKTEIKNILDAYKIEYANYYHYNFIDSNTITRIKTILKSVLSNDIIVDAENNVILDNNSYLINTWKDICNYISINKILPLNNDMIEYIRDEVQFTSESQNMINARIEIIKTFIAKLENKSIILK